MRAQPDQIMAGLRMLKKGLSARHNAGMANSGRSGNTQAIDAPQSSASLGSRREGGAKAGAWPLKRRYDDLLLRTAEPWPNAEQHKYKSRSSKFMRRRIRGAIVHRVFRSTAKNRSIAKHRLKLPRVKRELITTRKEQ